MNNILNNKLYFIVQICGLILTSLIILSFTSCSSVRSIRNGKLNTIKNNQFDSKSEIAQPIDEINKFEKIISKNDTSNSKLLNEYSTFANIVGSRLPTIREQMQLMSDSQDTMRTDIANVKKDINEIKDLLLDLKETIVDYSNQSTRLPVTGGTSNDAITSNMSDAKSNKSAILLPDEQVNTINNSKKINKIEKNKLSKKTISETFILSDEKVNNNSPKQIQKNVKSNENEFAVNNFLNQAKDFYNKRNYLSAIEFLEKALLVETSNKQESEINFYLGDSHYFVGNYDKSIEYLNKVINSQVSNYQDAARIRKAESNLKSGKVSEAKIEYQALIKNHPSSNYVPKARKMLQQL
jgi:tetratricopeptide (TPR) repeat protein